MKYLKQKLMAAVAMLMVSATMLSSVSYAWFTLSTNPEVKGMKATVSANQNLEIALDNSYTKVEDVDTASTVAGVQGGEQGSDSGNNYTWGNLVDLTNAFKAFGEDATITAGTYKLKLQPVKFTAPTTAATGSFDAPQYGKDGRIEKMVDLTAIGITAPGTGTTAGAISEAANDAASQSGFVAYKDADDYTAYSVAYWLRTNVAGNVSLITGTTNGATLRANDGTTSAAANQTTATDPNEITGAQSYIKVTANSNTEPEIKAYLKNLRIVFFEEIADTYGDNTDPTKPAKEVFRAQIDTATDLDSTDTGTYTYALKSITATEAGKKDSTLAGDTAAKAGTLAFEKNEAKKIVMYVYVDGETITNAEALLDDISIDMNIQFQNDAIDPGTATGKTEGAMNGDPVK